MKGFLRLAALAASIGIAAAGCGGGGSGQAETQPPTAPTVVVDPLPLPGPFEVACSNISQDFTRLGPGEQARDYWEGQAADNGMSRYATDLLSDPANTLMVTVTAPVDSDLYGSFAGDNVAFVVIACYPTTADNPYPDYPLTDNHVVPHMQTGTQPPLFADNAARYPVVAFSHGFTGSPISGDYLLGITTLASYGYVLISPFHGDLRFTDLHLQDLQNIQDILSFASSVRNFTTMQALRPLSISAALDLLLAHPQWQGHIDNTKIGGFGASMGGETMMLLGGASLTTSVLNLQFPSKRVTLDTRIKAAVGYVPYFGLLIPPDPRVPPEARVPLPAFGDDQGGLAGVTLPFLGISGTADVVAPIRLAEQGISRLAGTRELVALQGVEHGFDFASTSDIFTWTLTFFDAELLGNADAKTKISTMAAVSGGGVDNVVIPYNGLP